MSSLRKASKAAGGGRAHKERSQPGFRARFGLLEKHKDYVLRAKDFQQKQQHLQKLKEKAANRNPDEFFFKMVNSKVVDGQHRGDTGAKVYTADEMKLLRKQDAGYLVSKAQSEMKKVERLRSSVLPVSANKNKHVFFIENADEVDDVRERVMNRPAVPLGLPKVPTELTKETQKRSERAEKLKEMASAVELQKQLSGKGRKRKLPPSEVKNPSKQPVYKWRSERKR